MWVIVLTIAGLAVFVVGVLVGFVWGARTANEILVFDETRPRL